MIKFVNVTIGPSGNRRLNGCSFEIRRGEVVSVLGATGAGKSSVLAAAGRARIDEGKILWDGRDVSRSHRTLLSYCAYAHDSIQGPLELTAPQWVNFWLELAGVAVKERHQRLDAACQIFQTRESCTTRPMNELSRGERRVWDLVRLWASPQPALVLDGVSADLDGEGLARLTSAVTEAAAEGRTVIVAENMPHLPAAVSDRALVLDQGAVKQELSRSEPLFQSMVATAQGWAD